MSEENQVEEVETPQEEVEEQQEIEQVNPSEVKARQRGWVSRDEWVEQGKDESDWVSHKAFNEKGSMVSEMNRLKGELKKFDSRLKDNNEYWKLQLSAQKTELETKLDEAVDIGDKDEVKNLNAQIKQVEKAAENIDKSEAQESQLDAGDMQAENNYFASLGKGAQAYATQAAQPFIAQGLAGQALVDAVSAEVAREFPPTNPNRSKAPVTTSKSPSSKKPQKDSVSVASLGQADLSMINAMKNHGPYKGKSDSEILKILQDSKR